MEIWGTQLPAFGSSIAWENNGAKGEKIFKLHSSSLFCSPGFTFCLSGAAVADG